MAENQNSNRKNENVRRANRIIQTRSFVLMILMGVVMFVLLFFRLFDLQITRHEELQGKAVNQQTRRTVVTANRGTIYDAGGNILAISSSAETIILSPLEIDNAVNDTEDPVSWTKESLAAGLAEILGKDASAIRKRMDNVKSQYEVIQLRADEDTAAKVRSYVDENKIAGVHLVADTKRYYPYGSLAAQVIGFVGDENTGLYGLEAYYEKELEGQSGLVISSKDQAENDMLYTYEQYFAAKNGSDLTLTLDTTIQYYLEKGIESMVDKFSAANGASGIVMDAKTGGILAMASYPNYDLNDFLTVSDQTLQERIERGESTVADMQLLQWRNKALNDTYEPGSTFKILTLSAALEEGVVDKTTTVNCGGSVNISGYTIHCSNKNGHGLQTLVQSVGNSCNPAFINYGLRIGSEKFYEYMRSFGLMNTTGIDLGGEAVGVFAADSSFTQLDLACYAFGQNFTVTPLALIAAQAACINGGYLHTPYLVERITDSDGNVTYRHDDTPVRQVISEQTSATVRECLEYVVASGTGKNGQVAGYRIGGKTGSSQTLDSADHIIVSFLGFAPADDPEVIVLLGYDWPQPSAPGQNTTKDGTYISGGNMAAPMAGELIANILDYLGYQKSGNTVNENGVTIPNVVGQTPDEARAALNALGLNVRTSGEGSVVTDQMPTAGSTVPKGSSTVLYLGEEKPKETVAMPDLSGMTYEEAKKALEDVGLYLNATGSGTSGTVFEQLVLPGTPVELGATVEVKFAENTEPDNGLSSANGDWAEDPEQKDQTQPQTGN